MQSKQEQRAPRRFLRLPEVIARTGLGESTIYRRAKKGTFPSQHSLGGNIVGWLESDVEEWIDSRLNQQSRPAA